MIRVSRSKLLLILAIGLGGVVLIDLIKLAGLIQPSDDEFRATFGGLELRKRWSNGIEETGDVEEDEAEEQPRRGKAVKDAAGLKQTDSSEEERLVWKEVQEDETELSEEEELRFLEGFLAKHNAVKRGSEKKPVADEKKSEDTRSPGGAGREKLRVLNRLSSKENDARTNQGKVPERMRSKERQISQTKKSMKDTGRYSKGRDLKKTKTKASERVNEERKGGESSNDKIGYEDTKADEEEEEQKLRHRMSDDGNSGKNAEKKRIKSSSPQQLGNRLPISDKADIPVDKSRPIVNPHRFHYVVNCPDACDGAEVFLLCYVYSEPHQFKRRNRVRETWGNQDNYPGVRVVIVFFVGLPMMNTTDGRLTQSYVVMESKRHRDIVQEDYVDAHRTPTHKGMSALRWIATFCKRATYLLKTDDGMFVNTFVILNHLRNLHAEHFRNRLLMCLVYWRMQVGPDDGIPEGHFPRDTYPPYCSGMGVVMSHDVAAALYTVSPYVPYFPVHDVFISGLLPLALHGTVNHTSWATAYCAEFEMGVFVHPTEWYKYIFAYTDNEAINRKTWRSLAMIAGNSTIPRPSIIRPGHLADNYLPLNKLFPGRKY